jgi:hypothetical protein
MLDPKGNSLFGAGLAHLTDSMNKANAWKDLSAELVEIAAAFRRIANRSVVENAFQIHIESENEDERATYQKSEQR